MSIEREYEVLIGYQRVSRELAEFLKTQFKPGQRCRVQLYRFKTPPGVSPFDAKARGVGSWEPNPELAEGVVIQVSNAVFSPGVIVKYASGGYEREGLFPPGKIFKEDGADE